MVVPFIKIGRTGYENSLILDMLHFSLLNICIEKQVYQLGKYLGVIFRYKVEIRPSNRDTEGYVPCIKHLAFNS